MCLGAIGIVIEVDETSAMPTAVVDFGDWTTEVGVFDKEGLRPGIHVLVHSGFVLEVLPDDRAAEMLALRAEMASGS
jgi:hydrogenase maturation factor